MGTIHLSGHEAVPLGVGDDLLGSMLDGGLPAMYLCMAGSCGRCRVAVHRGLELLAPPTRAEEYHGCTGPDRLACQARLARDGAVEVAQG